MHKEAECYSPPFSNVTSDLEEVEVPVGVKQLEFFTFSDKNVYNSINIIMIQSLWNRHGQTTARGLNYINCMEVSSCALPIFLRFESQ